MLRMYMYIILSRLECLRLNKFINFTFIHRQIQSNTFTHTFTPDNLHSKYWKHYGKKQSIAY